MHPEALQQFFYRIGFSRDQQSLRRGLIAQLGKIADDVVNDGIISAVGIATFVNHVLNPVAAVWHRAPIGPLEELAVFEVPFNSKRACVY